jgi:hypothetical protein
MRPGSQRFHSARSRLSDTLTELDWSLPSADLTLSQVPSDLCDRDQPRGV